MISDLLDTPGVADEKRPLQFMYSMDLMQPQASISFASTPASDCLDSHLR